MRIAIVGAGYVGLTTSACLVKLGHKVTCCDALEDRIEKLRHGRVPIYEPGLEDLLKEGIASGDLTFTSCGRECVADADAIFLAVGTPSLPNGDIDLGQLENASRGIAPHLKGGAVVIVKSTVTAGTSSRIREVIAETRRSLDFSVASNPEFLREGSAVDDFMCPDRIVFGTDDARAAAIMREIYASLSEQGVPILATTTTNAELIKHAANAFLALKIGFINEVSDLCERSGGDVTAVARGIGLDKRIGQNFLTPGPGFGGSCFPKDTRAFAAAGRRHGTRQALVELLIERNELRKRRLAERIVAEAGLRRGSRVAVLGLAFKAGTDDARESPALPIIEHLQRAGVHVTAHDPQAGENALRQNPAIELAPTPYEAVRGADALVVLTEWEDYAVLDMARIAGMMRGRYLFDFRNVLPIDQKNRHNFHCIRLGRRSFRPGDAAPSGSGAAYASRSVAAPPS
ncbi:UDP-glucose dehydrogenase family protein [Aquamicrobium zhengzhouense]|uniref:UDP-glucose 6-dehydrogenase n=1 Tax=Aquamicrobium zhengzhouense TaxID=2781738 RepID=A0ABS0SDF1_9HYPH|nr:UDP-glucose/GDP-mannose dehydrogenase family protein [Aquamicrobium zhengzhouense]MBI1621271.1 UDP-glucose/GDP-mannose dehydrogenase family protein [Aquamicrobium zhengzhouense]